MGCGWFLLLWVLPQAWGSSEVLRRSVLFRCLQISSFTNSSWMRTDALAWLGELQTHSWSNASDTISFVKPWAQGTFSSQQWVHLQNIFRVFRSSFTRDIQEFAKMLSLEYPMELQLSGGCEVHPGNISEHFLRVAYQGEYILSFQGTAWESAPQAPHWVDLVIKVLNQDKGTRETVQWLLNDTCPQFVIGLLETGKSELEKQVKPEAWLSSGPSPGPGHLLLVCHVSGFYPQPVWVTWMRGEQEQQGTQRGDILPNADGTWYLRATLDVAAGEAAGLACRVKHSSLGGQDLVLYWAPMKTSCESSGHLPVWSPRPQFPRTEVFACLGMEDEWRVNLEK
ncbi:antigen-presenting glycoprotein CD1d-like isoform X1 [Urocitellus parryii]